MNGPRRPTPLAEALDSWIRRSGMVKRLDLAGAVAAWPEVVGPQIAAVTRALSVTPDGVLMVRAATHAWAVELGLMTPRILARLNGDRKGRVRQVRWTVGPIDEP
ncbi:MAG: DciA family protein [Gemmatimonadales bacterium]